MKYITLISSFFEDDNSHAYDARCQTRRRQTYFVLLLVLPQNCVLRFSDYTRSSGDENIWGSSLKT